MGLQTAATAFPGIQILPKHSGSPHGSATASRIFECLDPSTPQSTVNSLSLSPQQRRTPRTRRRGAPERRSHDYIRAGITTLS